jgi:hypothetical protein
MGLYYKVRDFDIYGGFEKPLIAENAVAGREC